MFVLLAGSGAWKYFWTLFGTSNQLLAALSLMGVSVWLKRAGKRYWYVAVPMVFVAAVTAVSLAMQIQSGLLAATATPVERINGLVSLVLLVLAGSLLAIGSRALLRREPPASPVTAG